MTFIDLAKEKKLSDKDIILIAETFGQQKILWTVEELAEKLNMSRQATSALMRRKDFPKVKNGNRMLAIASEVNSYLVSMQGDSL